MNSPLAPESRICGPADVAQQFVVERVYERALGAVPFAVWVYPKPVRVPRLSCGCTIVFDLLPESALQRTNGRRRFGLVVCRCMGQFVE